MKIVHVITSLDPDQGGPPRVVLGLAHAQSKLGHQVNIVTSWTQLSLIKSSQLVHLHGVWEPVLHKASQLASKYNLPYVVTPHGMLNTQHSLNQKKFIKKILLTIYVKKMLNQAKAVHLLNQAEKRSVSSLKLKSKISIIPNAVDPPPKRLPKNSFLPKKPYFIFLGRLFHKKGTSLLIRAFNQFKKHNQALDYHLVVAGPNAGALKGMKQQVSRFNLTKFVHFVGSLDDQAKFTALKQAQAFVLPSHQEAFSVAVLESLSVGTPVIISKQTNFPEVTKSNSGLIVNLDAENFALAMNQLASHPNYAKKLGRNGRQLVLKNYTWKKVAKQMLSLYKTL